MSDSTKQSLPVQKKSKQIARLHDHFSQVKNRFHQTHTSASRWLKNRSLDVDQLRVNSTQLLAAASLASGVALNQPLDVLLQKQLHAIESSNHHQDGDSDSLLQFTKEEHEAILVKMTEYVVRPPGHLETQEELYLEQQLSDMLGFPVVAQLEEQRLNHSIGIMGGEQHLLRYPGDTLAEHDAYREAGIAPARGAFGWFTENGVLTQRSIEREKYYFAVQTLYLPDWNTKHPTLKPWYAFRKMIAVNPAEQLAVVGVVGDAGPAQWVNKQFGGSPEVIREAKIWSPKSKGRVLLFFVDDPNDTIPLGVIDLSANAIFDEQRQLADTEQEVARSFEDEGN